MRPSVKNRISGYVLLCFRRAGHPLDWRRGSQSVDGVAVMMRIFCKVVSITFLVSGPDPGAPVSFDFSSVIRIYMVAALSLGLGFVIAWTIKLLKFGFGYYLAFIL